MQLITNVKKIKSLISRDKINYRDKEDFLMLKNDKIENVSEFKFWGNIIQCNSNLASSSDNLLKMVQHQIIHIFIFRNPC